MFEEFHHSLNRL